MLHLSQVNFANINLKYVSHLNWIKKIKSIIEKLVKKCDYMKYIIVELLKFYSKSIYFLLIKIELKIINELDRSLNL